MRSVAVPGHSKELVADDPRSVSEVLRFGRCCARGPAHSGMASSVSPLPATSEFRQLKSRVMHVCSTRVQINHPAIIPIMRKCMKKSPIVCAALLSAIAFSFSACAQNQAATNPPVNAEAKAAAAGTKSDSDQEKKAAEWVGALNLGDPAKEARVTAVIATHLKAVRDWHNEHPYTTVPAGTNSVTGKPLSILDREMIADSAMPKTVHTNLMAGLRKDLSEEQVGAILDKYTVGKVAFTMKGYQAIVPNLTKEEEVTILGFLKQAREEAVDYKNMNQISAIFKIYKTKSEQYLNANGRNWKAMYKAYTDAAKAKKAAAAATATNQPAARPVPAVPLESE